MSRRAKEGGYSMPIIGGSRRHLVSSVEAIAFVPVKGDGTRVKLADVPADAIKQTFNAEDFAEVKAVDGEGNVIEGVFVYDLLARYGLRKVRQETTSDKTTIDAAISAVQGRVDALLTGRWNPESTERGPQLTVWFEAYERHLTNLGRTPDDEKREEMWVTLRNANGFARIKGNAGTKACYDQIRAELAAKRAAESAEAAKAETETSDDDL